MERVEVDVQTSIVTLDESDPLRRLSSYEV